MGTFGTGLYDSDIAQDVKNMCEDIFPFVDVEMANKMIFQEFREVVESNLKDFDYVSFWYALADWQWKHGVLTGIIRDNALKLLASTEAEAEWKTKTDVTKRKKVLCRLKEQLTSEQPVRKIKKPKLVKPKHATGDIIVFKSCSEDDLDGAVWEINSNFFGRSILFESEQIRNADYRRFQTKKECDMYMAIVCVGSIKVAHSEYLQDVYDEYSVYAYYDYISPNKPTIEDLRSCGFLPAIFWRVDGLKTEELEWTYCFYMYCDDTKERNKFFAVVEEAHSIKEAERFIALKSRKEYGNSVIPTLCLDAAYTDMMTEKVRGNFLGYSVDNLLDLNCQNPQFLKKEAVILKKF